MFKKAQLKKYFLLFIVLGLLIFISSCVFKESTTEISIINPHSSPKAGDEWKVSFETIGIANLTITPDDQATIDDMDFVSLTCAGEERIPQILANDVIFYPDWSCDGTGELTHLVNVAAKHALKFQFGDEIEYAYNNPTISDSFDDETKISSKVNVVVDTSAGTVELETAGGIDSDTKLMMHMDGADDGTTFSDSSTANNKGNAAVTATAVTKTGVKKWGTASALFDGDSGYVSYADDADWDIVATTTEDWTIDFYVKHVDPTRQEVYIRQNEGGLDLWQVQHRGSDGLRFLARDTAGNVISTGNGGVISDTDFHHVAFVKVADEYAVYLDGTQTSYIQDSDTFTFAATLYIGQNGEGGAYFEGYMDEVRIQKSNYFGAAPNSGKTDTITVPSGAYSTRLPGNLTSINLLSGQTVSSIDSFGYNASSIPPGTYLKAQFSNENGWYNSSGTQNAWDILSEGTNTIDLSSLGWTSANFNYTAKFESTQADTVLLLHADGADASTTFTDSSGSAHTVTAYDNAHIETDQSKFGGTSAYFDGTGDYLSIADHADWSLGSDWTIEAWVHPLSTVGYDGVVTQQDETTGWYFSLKDGKPEFYIFASGSWYTSDTAVSTDTWSHIAAVGSSSDVKIYINGNEPGYTHSSGVGTIGNIALSLHVGEGFVGTHPFNGYIDEVRVIKGTALTQEQVEADYNATRKFFFEPYDSDTKLLLHMNGADGVTAFPDDSVPGSGYTVTAYDNAHIETDQSKFGGTSAYFDGTGDYLSIPDSDDWSFGSEDFTIDYWWQSTETSGINGASFGIAEPNTKKGIAFMYYNSDSKFRFKVGDGSSMSNIIGSTFSPNAGQWYHFAIVRQSDVYKLYIDGTLTDTYDTGITNFPDVSASFTIGRSQGSDATKFVSGVFYATGSFDEFRISKGVARWTSNFDPPTREYGISGTPTLDEINVSYTSDTCSCPGSGDFEISGGDVCELTTACDIGSNAFRINQGTMRIGASGSIIATGCYVNADAGLFMEIGAGFFCG